MKTPARSIAPYSTLLPFASGRPSLRRALLWTCIAGFVLGTSISTHAIDATWTATASTNGNWEDPSKWIGNTIPGGVGSIVNFYAANLGTQTITITAAETAGVLNFGGGNTPTLAASGAGTLTMDNGGSGAQINNINSPYQNATISVQIILADAGGLSITDTRVGSGAFTFSGGITSSLTTSITNNATGTHAIKITGAITGANLSVVQNSASSVLTLSGTNTFNGLYINAGTVALTSTAAAGTGTIFLGSGAADATLASPSGGGTSANAIYVAAGSGARTIDNSSGNSRTFSSAITLANDLTVKEHGANSFVLSGNILGTGNINIINDSGVFTLSGASVDNAGEITYSGANTVSGTFSGALGSHVTAITQNSSSSTLLLSGANTAFTGAVNVNAGTLKLGNVNAVNANNVVTVGAGIFDVNSYAVTIAGLNDAVTTGTVTNSGASAKVLTLGGAGNYSFGGVITAATPANLAVTKTGAGTQIFTGANTYTGVTTISSGTLQLGDGTSGHDGSVAGNITNNSDLVYNLFGTQTYGGNITGNGTLTKSGVGTLTLSSTSGYTGATVVGRGQLNVNGSIVASSGVTIKSGAILSGSGRVGKVSVNAGGTLKGTLVAGTISGAGLVAPGNSPGILTAESVDGSTGLSFAFELTKIGAPTYSSATASDNDVLHLTGATPFTTSLNSSNTITVYLASEAVGSTYLGGIFTDSLTVSLLKSAVENAKFVYYVLDTDSDTTGDISYNGNYYTTLSSSLSVAVSTVNVTSADFSTGTVSGSELEFTVVPEPSTWAICVGGLGMLIVFGRFRKRMSA